MGTTFCEKVLARPELSADPRFSSNVARCQHSEALDEIIQAAFLAVDRVALLASRREHRVAFGEVNGLRGFSTHPSLSRVPVPLPSGETVQAVMPPALFDG